MNFHPPLIKATLHKRSKRFIAHITLSNQEKALAHCPNTGSMQSCYEEGNTIYVSRSLNPQRKLPYTWELTQTTQGYIGINTHRTNALVKEALENKILPEFKSYNTIQQEVHYQTQGRLDFRLQQPQHQDVFIEVKNATLYDPRRDAVLFPDAPTQRGRKHLTMLSDIAQTDCIAVLLFVVNRPEGTVMTSADHIDPEYGQLLRQAQHQGVRILAWRTQAQPPHSLWLSQPVTVDV